ncbi:BCCT family transporter [Corynebacterium sp. HMSC05C01]|uniref:BCCT family transporter n=1 Tax=Corynebacterium sp. HMSC05C01 TaxID=1581113 RepID=UPI0009F51508
MPRRSSSTSNKRPMRVQRTQGVYPDDMHPGLVPGISVEESRHNFSLDKVVFGVTAAAILAFIIWGVTSPEQVGSSASSALSWGLRNFGWLFNIVLVACVIIMAVLAFSRFGNITLGKDDEEPEYSFFSWVAMMFAAGIGVGIFFFGPSEPLTMYLDPPPLTVEAETEEALHRAIAQANFHWGLSPWALYALVGGAMAYSCYRRGRPTLMSSLFTPVFKRSGPFGTIIDILAIVATLFGTAATLGISTLQIGDGIAIMRSGDSAPMGVLLTVMGVLTIGFVISAVSGVGKGIRILSNINISLTSAAILFIFATGPTLLLVNLLPSGTLVYADRFFDMASRSLSWGEDTLDFQSAWTAFYWAWWIAWAPFVGMFIARISRGRTLRQFAVVTTLVPTAVLICAFTIFGGTAITFSREGREGFDGTATPQQVLFNMFGEMPLAEITPYILIGILAVFFITSADSASVIMGSMSSKGDPEPNKLVVVFWGLAMMGIAVVMLLSGGEDALSGLQSLTILSAMPFSVVILLLMYSFIKDLSTDPIAIRNSYARNAVKSAVIRGIEEYGDDFEIVVEPSAAGEGAGAEFDSTSDEYTDWYRRTDEEGTPVGYDYETGEWSDGYQPEEEDSTTAENDGAAEDNRG